MNHDDGYHSKYRDEETFAFEDVELVRDYHAFGAGCLVHSFVCDVLHEMAVIDLDVALPSTKKTVSSSEVDHLCFSEVTGYGMSYVDCDLLCEEDSSLYHLQIPSSSEGKVFSIENVISRLSLSCSVEMAARRIF